MRGKDILFLWLGLPLTDRIRLYGAGKVSGLEGQPALKLFPEKPEVEAWIIKLATVGKEMG